MDEIVRGRKHGFKRGIDKGECDKTRWHRDHCIRREEREKHFALKRLSATAPPHYAEGSPGSCRSHEEGCSATKVLQLCLTRLEVTGNALYHPTGSEGVQALEDFTAAADTLIEAAVGYRHVMSSSPFLVTSVEDCVQMTSSLVRCLELGFRVWLQSCGLPIPVRTNLENLIFEVLSTIGHVAASEVEEADQADDDTNAHLYSPLLPQLYALCALNIVDDYPFKDELTAQLMPLILSPTLCNVNAAHTTGTNTRLPQILKPFRLCQATATAIGNLAADCPKNTLEMHSNAVSVLSGIGSGDICHASWNTPLSVLRTATTCLNYVGTALSNPTRFPDGKESIVGAEVTLLGETTLWLLSNCLRCRDILLTEVFIFQFDMFPTLLCLLEVCSRDNTAGADMSIFARPSTDHLRVVLGESLWCLVYCCVAVPRLFNRIAYVNSVATKLLSEVLVKLVAGGIVVCSEEMAAVDPRTPLLTVDILLPALQLINCAAASSTCDSRESMETANALIHASNLKQSFVGDLDEVQRNNCLEELYAPTNAVDVMLAMSGFSELIRRLLRHTHRGIVRDSAQLAATIASTNAPHHAAFIMQLLPDLALGFRNAAAFDIKREFASCLLHLSLNHSQIHLPNVLAATPNVLETFVDMFSTCKYDNIALNVGLQFVEGILRCVPEGRSLLYNNNFVTVAEKIQDMHSGVIARRITHILTTYFDDVDDLDCSEQFGIEAEAL